MVDVVNDKFTHSVVGIVTVHVTRVITLKTDKRTGYVVQCRQRENTLSSRPLRVINMLNTGPTFKTLSQYWAHFEMLTHIVSLLLHCWGDI